MIIVIWWAHIALSRDPSTRHLDGQFQIWTGEIFRGRVTTRHSVIRPRPGSLYDGCHRVITGIQRVLYPPETNVSSTVNS